MSIRNPTKTKLGELLLKIITGVEGGSVQHWAEIIGPVHQLPVIDNIGSNWAVIPGGTRKERTMIANAAETVRKAHPYVNG